MTQPDRHRKRVEANGGRYVARVEGVEGEAELIFTLHNPRETSADYTEAPASMRATGAAAAPIEHRIADARASGFKIIPLCPYVLTQYGKHTEWSDIIGSGDST